MVTRQDSLPISACLCLRNQVTTKQQWRSCKGDRRYWTVVVHVNISSELILISYCKHIQKPQEEGVDQCYSLSRRGPPAWWKTFQRLTLCFSSLLCLLSFFLQLCPRVHFSFSTILQDYWPRLSRKRWASSQWNLGVFQKTNKQNRKT